jgi:hypothetical protein
MFALNHKIGGRVNLGIDKFLEDWGLADDVFLRDHELPVIHIDKAHISTEPWLLSKPLERQGIASTWSGYPAISFCEDQPLLTTHNPD